MIRLGIIGHSPNSLGSNVKVVNNVCRILRRNQGYDISYCAKPYGWMGGIWTHRSILQENTGLPPQRTDYTVYDGGTHKSRLNYIKSVRPDILINIGGEYTGDDWVFPRKSSELYRTCVNNGTQLIRYSPIHSVPLPSEFVDTAKGKCDLQLTMSEYGRNALLAQGVTIERCDYVYHGVDTSFYKKRDRTFCRNYFGLDAKSPVIGYIAMNYDYRKMLPLAMIAFRRVQSVYPKAQLFMGTAPTPYWDLEAWKTNLDLKNVFFANSFYQSGKFGFSEEELAMLYSSMDCYIHPSTAEGFGLPVLEAMASAVPIVCTDLPVFRELFDEIPYYALSSKFIPTTWGSLESLVDVDDMASKILHILDPENYKEVDDRIKKGLEKVSKYSWESSVIKLESIIDRISARQP